MAQRNLLATIVQNCNVSIEVLSVAVLRLVHFTILAIVTMHGSVYGGRA